jgi:hypothetical protein
LLTENESLGLGVFLYLYSGSGGEDAGRRGEEEKR